MKNMTFCGGINGDGAESLKKYVYLLTKYEGKSISKLQIQVATYVFELSAGNCQC
jgi:hypothetical protein